MSIKTKKNPSEGVTVLSKYLAQTGYCSRREAVEIIATKKVTINGVHATHPATPVPDGAVVKVGSRVIRGEPKIYLLLNKPKGYVTTVEDDKDRRTVMELLAGVPKVRLYPVGRLDMDTTGLLVMTNDGELAQKLSHPKFEIEKTYTVKLDKPLQAEHLMQIRKGLRLKDGLVKVDSASYVHPKVQDTITVVIHSGKNRIVRRIFAHLGYYVDSLDRVGYSFLKKDGLPQGHWRPLSPKEVSRLKQ